MVWTLSPDEGHNSVTLVVLSWSKKKRKTKKRKGYETSSTYPQHPSKRGGGKAMPVDGLLIEGSYIVQEVVITGKSAP